MSKWKNIHLAFLSQKGQNSTNDSESRLSDLNEEEEREWEQMYTKTEAAQYIGTGDIVVIKTGDD